MSWDPRRLHDRAPLPRAVAVAALVAFMAVTFFVAWHHEAWRDEADPWLRARDGDFRTLVLRGAYTGYPILWHILLVPLAKSGLPYFSQSVLHLAIAAAAVALLLWRLPLAWPTRLLAAFSYFFAYEYAVIARASAPAIALAFAAAAMHRQRAARPFAYAAVLALLFNVSAQGFIVAGALAALFVLELRPRGGRALGAAAIMAAAAALSALQVRTPPDPSRIGRLHPFDFGAFVSSIADAFFPTLPPWPAFLAGVVLIGLLALALQRSRAALLVFWLPFAVLTLLYGYVWYGGVRHAGFVLVLALLAIAVGEPEGAERRYAAAAALLLNLALAISCVVAARFWIVDTNEAFSGAEEMGEFIRGHGLERFDVAAHSAQQAEAVLPYLPGKRFWYAGIGEEGSYMEWDAAYERGLDVWYPVAELRARQHFAGRPWLLLFNVEMPDPAAHGFRLLYTNRRPIFAKKDERFWLYAPLR